MSIAETAAAPAGLTKWLPIAESCAAGGGAVEVVETSLSWVLLTDRHAYKIKKAVDLGEAHFRSPVRRRQACLDEVRLNLRLAASVYLGVVPLSRDATGELRIGGGGDPIEWAVKMRRLPRDRNLLWLMDQGNLTKNQVESLSAMLADFYYGSPPETEVLDHFRTRLRRRIEDNTRYFEPRFPSNLRRNLKKLSAAQHEYLDGARMVLNLRVCDGRVVDGHGDLRPEHIFLERQPVIIDCVEYSATRRKTDALDDLCALAMECQRRERSDIAEALMSAYRERTGDECFPHLEAFYRSLHACARAKSAFAAAVKHRARATQRRLAEAESYLKQAEHDAQTFV